MAGEPAVEWPAALRGVTETVVATLGPNGRWNLAALGVHAPDSERADGLGERVALARTWGDTRTKRNFEARAEGVVQFTRDPVDFVEAALTVRESEEAVLESADAWARVAVEELDRGTAGGTDWVDWSLRPVEVVVRREVVPTTNRGYGAVVEASVAASRLDVEGFDTAELEARIEYLGAVVSRCGGPKEREALAVVRDAMAE